MPILSQLTLYPIKSCAGIALQEATLTQAGLMSQQIYNREWMVVDTDGNCMTQRVYPKMATIAPRIRFDQLELRAPGMLQLNLVLDLPHPDDAKLISVQVWDDRVDAYDCDELTATWFSAALGVPCRLVRFHPDATRIAKPIWTKDVQAPILFADGFPLLVISQASLDDLNQKLVAQGRASLPMNRFRPSIVLDGVGAFEEDFAALIQLGAARIKPVKPCVRCPIPSVDQEKGAIGPDPLDILGTYRADARMDGGITFGMNAILLEGDEEILRVGQEITVELAF